MISHLPEEVKFTHYLLVQLFGYMSVILHTEHCATYTYLPLIVIAE